jgi:gliding motility-associated-like protein
LISTVTYAIPKVSVFPDDTFGCSPVCVNFRNESFITSGSIRSWYWDFGDSTYGNSATATHCYTDSGVFSLTIRATSNFGCSTTAYYPKSITVYGLPQAAFLINPQRASILNSLVQFTDRSTGADSWTWDFGDRKNPNDSSTQRNPSHLYSDTGTYAVKLIVANKNFCTDTLTEYLVIYPEFTFFVPNAFTPNGDGLNDGFGGVGLFVNTYTMTIFDRWGNLIFQSDAMDKKWDGKANYGNAVAQQDVYVYRIEVSDFQGNSYKYLGEVTLLK